MRRPKPWQLVATAVSLASLCASCGAGTANQQPKTTAPDRESAHGTGNDPDGDAPTTSPVAAACADGSCFACGEGYCPTGWYCDEAAAGGAACAWLPSCAATPTCACLGQTLGAACRCEASDGALRVRCD